jgi:hypothetical protein
MRLAEQNIWSCGIDVPRFGLAKAKKRTDGQSVSAKGWSFIFVNYLIETCAAEPESLLADLGFGAMAPALSMRLTPINIGL